MQASLEQFSQIIVFASLETAEKIGLQKSLKSVIAYSRRGTIMILDAEKLDAIAFGDID